MLSRARVKAIKSFLSGRGQFCSDEIFAVQGHKYFSYLSDRIGQCADAINGNPDFVSLMERERIRWNDAGPGKQEASLRKNIVTI